ncbi:uncharacterized protein LOC142581990 [Dermacentor variabilis]|uniref:uncharacterized protein LOC142581990 n=1 Tax=Dermacentor variabilis TaxID=34621 RepID=UPI003F5B9C14
MGSVDVCVSSQQSHVRLRPTAWFRGGREGLLRRRLPSGERARLPGHRGALHVRRGEPAVAFRRHVSAEEETDLRLHLLFTVVDCVRELLPPNSVIGYFNLKHIRLADDSGDSAHEGIFGEFLFHAEPAVRPAPTTDDLQQPPPLDSSVPGAMQSRRLDTSMRSLGEGFGPTTDTIAVAFPRNQDEARLELEALEHSLQRVLALASQATKFNVQDQFAPIGRLKLILLLIKPLD